MSEVCEGNFEFVATANRLRFDSGRAYVTMEAPGTRFYVNDAVFGDDCEAEITVPLGPFIVENEQVSDPMKFKVTIERIPCGA
jgi:hypothetical protein